MPKDKTENPLSLKNRIWGLRPTNDRIAKQYVAAGLNGPTASILSGRDLGGLSIQDFLDPKLRNLMPNPSRFIDMDAGTSHVADRIRCGEKIGIWSDYDADGATSGAILVRFLRMVGAGEAPLRIPDRITEGYGPNTPGLLKMLEEGCRTVCILDAGTVAFEPLSAAKKAGLDVVVIDHHAAEDTVPSAVAIINPNRKDEAPGYGHLCAAGMTFIFCVGVAVNLRDSGYFDGREGRPPHCPDLMTLLDLVALGTVCDVVPLLGLNRAFVTQGLKYLTKRTTPGIKALAEISAIAPNEAITATHCGWRFGPRINAGGRVSDSTLGARCLMTDDPQEAVALAERLEACNQERKALEKDATEQAMAQMSDRAPGECREIAIAVVEAHEGVVGISAARIKEAVDAPSIVLTPDHDGNLKGSARSVPGFDIGHAIIDARHENLIVKGGGHGMAGGLTLRPDQLDTFRAFMNKEIEKSEYFRTGVISEADIALRVSQLKVESLEGLGRLEPCGTANPEPVIILKAAELRKISILKGVHMKLTLGDGSDEIDGLIWNVVGTPIGDAIQALEGRAVDVLGQPGINEFRGVKKPQILIEDLRPSSGHLI